MKVRKNTLFVVIALCCILYLPTTYVLWGGAVVVILTLDSWIRWMPVIIQYPYYRFIWKKRALSGAKQLPPLIAYPMVIFVELSLDHHFKRGGVEQAHKALLAECDRLQAATTTILEQIIDKNRKTA